MRTLLNALSGIAVIIAVVLVVLLAGVRLIGVQPFVVTSGSMEPAFPVGSVVYSVPINASELRIGDAITFDMGGGLAATHRIVAIEGDGDGLAFRTKGDANDATDGNPVSASQIIGKATACIPAIGYVALFSQTFWGRCIFLAIGLILIVAIIIAFAGRERRR